MPAPSPEPELLPEPRPAPEPTAEEQIGALKAELTAADCKIIMYSEYQAAGLNASYDIAQF